MTTPDRTRACRAADKMPGTGGLVKSRQCSAPGDAASVIPHKISARYERLMVLELWLGWDCTCGVGGPDQASLTLHAHEHDASVSRWLGQYVNGVYQEAERV